MLCDELHRVGFGLSLPMMVPPGTRILCMVVCIVLLLGSSWSALGARPGNLALAGASDAQAASPPPALERSYLVIAAVGDNSRHLRCVCAEQLRVACPPGLTRDSAPPGLAALALAALGRTRTRTGAHTADSLPSLCAVLRAAGCRTAVFGTGTSP